MAKPAFAAPDTQAPEVYRSSPFEYVVTAEPLQIVVTCGEAIPWARPWVKKEAKLERVPSLPQWMARPPQG
jgi:hypothetical protein